MLQKDSRFFVSENWNLFKSFFTPSLLTYLRLAQLGGNYHHPYKRMKKGLMQKIELRV